MPMRIEGGALWTRVIRFSAVAAALLGPPVYNHDISVNVIGGLSGADVGCSSPEELSGTYPYDVIAVPGASLYYNLDTKSYEPSTFERRRLDAAALLYIHGYADTVVLLSGKKDVGLDATASAQYLIDQVSRYSQGAIAITMDQIVVEGNSINTATNIRELSKITPDGRIIFADDEFHSLRTIIYACAQGLNADMMTVEEVFNTFQPDGLDQISIDSKLEDMPIMEFKELLEIILVMYDREVYLPTFIKMYLLDN